MTRDKGHRVVMTAATKVYTMADSRAVALPPVDLIVESGEFVAIVGVSGCGKSTLLELVSGLLTPTSGSISVGGKTGQQSSCSIVFQEYALFPWRNVIRNIEYPLEVRGVSRPDRRSLSELMLRRVGLEGFGLHYPDQISGGMRQRAALARALITAPRLLLLDEPFAAADSITRRELQEQLAELVRVSNLTTILVTHSLDEALFLADRVAVLSRSNGIVRVVAVPGLGGSRDIQSGGYPELHQILWNAIRADSGLHRRRPASIADRR